MKENKYDDNIFFRNYSQMSRSQQGLAGAVEWETLRKLLPDFKDKRVLDLGCGYGWHCIYAMEHGEIALVVKGKNGSEPYTGNNLKPGLFTVTVSETDRYEIRITGKGATGKVFVKNVGK